MRFIKKFPLFLGWLFPSVIALALTLLLGLPFRGKSFTIQSEFVIFVVLYITFYFLITFLMFMVSIKNIVIPLYQKNAMASTELGQLRFPSYLYHWFLWWVYSMLYCLPLICWNSLITIVPSHPAEKVIRHVWDFAASYFAYRFVVKQWIEKSTSDEQPENEKQTPAA
ncbi:MAG: hypothetical protein U0X92_05780 [Anaerolineales bacterium]